MKCVVIPEHKRRGKTVKKHVRCFRSKAEKGKRGTSKAPGTSGGGGGGSGPKEEITNQLTSSGFDNQLKELQVKAKESAPEIDKLGKDYAKKYGGSVTPINLKSEKSIIRKANNEEKGDISKIKDSVRNTVMVKNRADLNRAVKDLRNDPRVERVKVQDGPGFYGYRGVIANVRTKNGIVAEVQLNTPEMIYAKGDISAARGILGKDLFRNIAEKSGKPCCKGHTFYEAIRVWKADKPKLSKAERDILARQIRESRKYYRTFS